MREIQEEILRAMHVEGARYSTSDKEGGTTLPFAQGRFMRIDYGESEQTQAFETDGALLAFPRAF